MATSFTLKINGTSYDSTARSAAGIWLQSFTPLVRSGVPNLRFCVRNIPWVALPDPYSGKPIELLANFNDGLGNIGVFKGDCWTRMHTPTNMKHVREYNCTGLRDRADRVPVTDESSGTNVMVFNARTGDRDYRASRAGRTVGECIIEALSQQTTITALDSYGVGAYIGQGTGARAHCVMSGHSVASIVVDSGGSGYSAGNRVNVLLVGGGGTGATAGNYSVSGGGVSAIPVGSGGSGYTTAPTVVFTRLPVITMNDLLAIDQIPTMPINISGERIMSAIEGVLEDRNPNYWLDIEYDGTIRFHDQRKFGSTTVNLSGGGSPTRTAIIVPVVVKGKIEALWIADGGAGYSGAPTISFTDPTGTGASYSLSASGGSVTGFTKSNAGSNYLGGRAKLRIDSKPLFSDTFSVGRDVRNCYQRVVCVGATNNQAYCFKQSDGTLLKNYAHDGLDNAGAEYYWKLDDYVNPFEVGSTAIAGTPTVASGGVASIPVSSPGYGYPPSSTTIAVSVTPAPGSGAILRINVNPTTHVISTVDVLSGGTGYDGTAAPTLTLVGGGGTGATFTVNRTGGVITGVIVTNGGSGYTYQPNYILYGLGAGSGATAHATSNAQGNVSSVVVDSAGSGYTRAPIARIAGHGGSAARSAGTCVPQNSTTVRITPSDGLATWAADYWDQTDSGIHGTVFLKYTDGAGAVHNWAATVTSNTALTAGSYSDLTVDPPLDSLSYSSFDLVGDATPASRVHRMFIPADPAIRTKLQDEFSRPISVGNADGNMVVKKTHRFAKIVYRPTGSLTTREVEWPFDLNRDTGTILFKQPVVCAFGQTANLTIGGPSTDGWPTDIEVWVPVQIGSLTATYPPDSKGSPVYGGDTNTYEGMTFTKYVNISSWIDPSQNSAMLDIAEQIYDTLKNAVVEGPFLCDDPGRAFFHPGVAFDFALTDGTDCGMESAKAPLVSAAIQWHGEQAIANSVNATVSTRCSHYTGSTAIPPVAGDVQGNWPSGEADIMGLFATQGDGGDDFSGGLY